MKKIEAKSRYQHAKDAIANHIREHCRDGSQLPSESQFAQMLGVSRNTVREALRILEREGLIFSRQGVGTFVINSGQILGSNLTILTHLADFIRDHGYEPGSADIVCCRESATDNIAARLSIPEGAEVIRVEGVRTADGQPVIFVRNYYRSQAIWKKAEELFRNEGFFDVLFEKEGVRISHSNCGVHAVVSDDELGHILGLNHRTALLMMEQTHFDTRGDAVMYSECWYISEKFNFTVVRRNF